MIGLSGDLTDPFEVLARTLGTRATDLIQVLPVPVIDEAGYLRTRFLVHGGRYVAPREEVPRTVHAGHRLSLAPEPENPSDRLAVLYVQMALDQIDGSATYPCPWLPSSTRCGPKA